MDIQPIFCSASEANKIDSAYFLSQRKGFFCTEDFKVALSFLCEYSGSPDTYNTYRRELERFLQWCWLIKSAPLVETSRQDIVDYITFFRNPPRTWFSAVRCRRFLDIGGELVANSAWRPFVGSPKTSSQSPASVRSMISVLSSYFEYLVQESIVVSNPVKMIRKRQLIQTKQEIIIHRQLSSEQWDVLLDTIRQKSIEECKFERHLFILSCFFLLGLRISEIASSPMQSPTMNQFYQDHENCWWFKTIGKGNKSREIAVPDDCLKALKRYRNFLGMTDFPMFNDHSPLLPKEKGRGSLGIRRVRGIVKESFSYAVDKLKRNGCYRDAQVLDAATTHWLRHTSISHDVLMNRSITDIRDDAGHQSIETTNVYLQSSRKNRYYSAKGKRLKPTGGEHHEW